MKRITIQLPDELAAWVRASARASGRSVSSAIANYLRVAQKVEREKPYLNFAGRFKGLPRDLSMREGYGPR